MMIEELDLELPGDNMETFVEGVIMFCSFILFGSMPLLAYTLFPIIFNMDADQKFTVACIVTGVTLFILGALKVGKEHQNQRFTLW